MPMKLPIVPTMRTAWLIVLAAPFALVIAASAPGLWIIAPIAGLLLMLLMVLDGLLAGRLSDWEYRIPKDTELGEPCEMHVSAAIEGRSARSSPRVAIALDRRLAEEGRSEFGLAFDRPSKRWQGLGLLTPNRRGPGKLQKLWLRWSGPLGLGARQKHFDLDAMIKVWPDLSPVRSPELQNYLRDAQFGMIARRIRGEGTQFEALTEYEPGMDRRRIDWKASARHTRLYARENESERNNQIVFAFDCGRAMCEPVDGLSRLDRVVSAALTASYVALKGGDKISLFGFAQHPQLLTPFYNDTRAFPRLQSAAAELDYSDQEANFTLALATLTARLKRRSLVVIFTDFTDPTGAEIMLESVGRLVKKHLVLFVTISDTELERLTQTKPDSIEDLAVAVTAGSLEDQRRLVLEKLKHMGVDIIEAPWNQIGYQLIDAYLDIKRHGAIG